MGSERPNRRLMYLAIDLKSYLDENAHRYPKNTKSCQALSGYAGQAMRQSIQAVKLFFSLKLLLALDLEREIHTSTLADRENLLMMMMIRMLICMSSYQRLIGNDR